MAITYGISGQPAQSTFNYDALVASSVGKYSPVMKDNISKLNIFFKKLKDSGSWETEDAALFYAEDLMYGLSPFDTYEGMDELPLTPTEGITQAQYLLRQAAVPIAISERERKINKHRIINLIAAKLMQADIGMQEGWAKGFIQGALAQSSANAATSPWVSNMNGSQFIDPLFAFIHNSPSSSFTLGGLDQSTYTWWRNQATTSAATTQVGFLQEIDQFINNCSKGPGGKPDIMWADQTTFELLTAAYYAKYRTEMTDVGDYPFPVVKFRGVLISWDEFMPDIYSGTLATSTYGTLVAINSKFFKIKSESETDFSSTEFAKPVNQDAKYKHILWMGSATCSNRRKHGVMQKIARTLS